jgi:hypothetical protein
VAGAAASLTNAELWAGRRAERTTLCGLLIVSAIGAASSGRFFPHYYIALLPALTLLAAPVLAQLWRDTGRTRARRGARRLSLAWVTAAAALFFVIDCLDLARLAPETQAGLYIRSHSEPDERLFVWGRQTQIYLDARRRPASRYISTFPLTGYIFGPPLPDVDTSARILPGAWNNLARDFLAHSPRYIVDVEVGPSARYPINQFPTLAHLLATEYRPVLRTEDSVVYQRMTAGAGRSPLAPGARPRRPA